MRTVPGLRPQLTPSVYITSIVWLMQNKNKQVPVTRGVFTTPLLPVWPTVNRGDYAFDRPSTQYTLAIHKVSTLIIQLRQLQSRASLTSYRKKDHHSPHLLWGNSVVKYIVDIGWYIYIYQVCPSTHPSRSSIAWRVSFRSSKTIICSSKSNILVDIPGFHFLAYPVKRTWFILDIRRYWGKERLWRGNSVTILTVLTLLAHTSDFYAWLGWESNVCKARRFVDIGHTRFNWLILESVSLSVALGPALDGSCGLGVYWR